MKNLLLAGIVGAIMSVSCSTVKTAKTAQSDRVEFLKLKGDWEVTSVDYVSSLFCNRSK